MEQILQNETIHIPRLIDRINQGDAQAFSAIYRYYSPAVYRYLYSRVGNQQDAEELTSQTFLAVLENLSRYRNQDKFTGWLFTIARNKAADHFRNRENQAETIDVDSSFLTHYAPLEKMIQDERSQALAGLIHDLSEPERDWLRLRYVAGLTFHEMGHVLGRNPDAIKKALYRLLARLQQSLEDEHVS